MECDPAAAADSTKRLRVPETLDKPVAGKPVECFSIRVKDEPVDSANELLLDDALRLQIERSIEMVVNEFSATTTTEARTCDAGGAAATATAASARNKAPETTVATEVDSRPASGGETAEAPMMPDSTPAPAAPDGDDDAEASAFPTSTNNASEWSGSVEAPATKAMACVAAEASRARVKCEPRDPTSSSGDETGAATTTAAKDSKDAKSSSKPHPANTLDLLAMLSIEKKPSALSILPVSAAGAASTLPRHPSLPASVTNGVEFSLTPNVTIKSVPGGFADAATPHRYRSWNEPPSQGWPPAPCYVSSSSHSGKAPVADNCSSSSFSLSPDSSMTGHDAAARNAVSTSNPYATCCSPSSASRTATSGGLFGKHGASARVALPPPCSYASACDRKSSATYSQLHPYHHPHLQQPASFAGLRGYPAAPSGAYVSTAPPAGLYCTSAATPSGLCTSSKSSPFAPPPLGNSCRMSMSSPTGAYLRPKELPYSAPLVCNVMPDSSGAAVDSAPYMPPPPFRSWNTTAAGSAFRGSGSARSSLPSFGFSPPKASRVSSMSALVRHSNASASGASPTAYAPYSSPAAVAATAPTSLMMPGHGASPMKANAAVTPAAASAYPGGGGGSFPPSPFAAPAMPFHRSQCCFSSQIQCFNAACDNAAQQHVSIVQHSTRLSNLKSNSMDSISSLLQYHTYFKKY